MTCESEMLESQSKSQKTQIFFKSYGRKLTNYLSIFGHNFRNRNARWPIKGSKDLYCSLVSIKNLSQKIGSLRWCSGPGNLGQKGLNLPHLKLWCLTAFRDFREKNTKTHMDLRGNFSGPVSATDPVKRGLSGHLGPLHLALGSNS